MAGGRFNSETEANYAPLEGELLGIASALHKSRYFTSGHPNLTVFTDHKPICNMFNDVTRQINNKRLSNLRRKCDGFIFKTIYARGVDNTTDAISRIKGWEEHDSDRFQPVEDNKDLDDSSIQINVITKAKMNTIEKLKKFTLYSNKFGLVKKWVRLYAL